ncbi:hypothetical protein FF2_006361 [Malus domestica]
MESSTGPELPSQITCFEILPRLPSKSLMRFKCVCKSWSSLTQNPSFVEAHHHFGRNKYAHLLLTTWDQATSQQHFFSSQIDQQGSLTPATHVLTLPTLRTNGCLYTAQSINGLVCLYLQVNPVQINQVSSVLNASISNQIDHGNPVHIFNPCTREGESIALPHTSSASSTTYVTHHFGFSPLTNKYKVLQVQKFVRAGSIHFMFNIFTMGINLWKRIEADLNNLPFDPHSCLFYEASVCVNGAIHWMNGSQNMIVGFDIEDEKFSRVIQLPKDYNLFRVDQFMVEVGGRLALGDRVQLMRQNIMRLWILNDYENQVWVKESFKFPIHWRELGYPLRFYTIHTGELLVQFPRLNTDQVDLACMRVHLYDMKSESFRSYGIVLPAEWTFRNNTRLKVLTSYEDSIVPLR